MARSTANYDSQVEGCCSTYKVEGSLPLLETYMYSPSAESRSSMSDLSSLTTSVSARVLYANTFDRPFTSQSLPTSPRTRRPTTATPQTKNMGDMFGTITEQEFDALPIAVRRKYFSSLERLRFAKSSVENDHRLPVRRKPSIADRRGVRSPLVDSSRHFNSKTTQRPRKLVRQSSNASTDVSWFLTLPDKIQRREAADSNRALITKQSLEPFVIFDAADQNIHKARRKIRINRQPSIISSRSSNSMDSTRSTQSDSIHTRSSSMTKAIFDSFRWMDEEEDLDLRLVLDDYHANVDGVVIPLPHTSHPQRPSFRRNVSISKAPFGRTSFSSLNSPMQQERPQTHLRSGSRAISLIGPMGSRHAIRESISSIDAHATHYQDPEARLKLRVYLASPQKFDEAIEFGFPSMDNGSVSTDKENRVPRKLSREGHVAKSPLLTGDSATFLNDDNVSLSSSNDDASMMDPDSPLTPAEAHDGVFRNTSSRPSWSEKRSMSSSNDFSHLGIKKPIVHRHKDSMAQQMAGSREMTLRMTLTRPDLRADETQLYGWQEKPSSQPRGKSPLTEETMAPSLTSVDKYEKMGPFGGVDGWGPMEKEDGVVKRLWNRVRSGPKKTL